MPTERLSMRHIREVLRLHHSVGMSQRAVARSLNLAQGTVDHHPWNPPLLLVAPPTPADDARDLRPAPNNLRVVTDVDHNVHTIRDPSKIAIVHNPVRSTMWEQSTAYDEFGVRRNQSPRRQSERRGRHLCRLPM